MTAESIIMAVVAIVAAVFGSSGYWSYRTAKKDKSEQILKELKSLNERVSALESTQGDAKAEAWRDSIVDLAEFITKGGKPSKERLYNTMDKVTLYEAYCSEHPKFRNNTATWSIEVLKDAYKRGCYE